MISAIARIDNVAMNIWRKVSCLFIIITVNISLDLND